MPRLPARVVGDVRTGALRMARGPRLPLGQDIGWALWLPDGRHLIVGTWPGISLVDSATLSARPLFLPHGNNIGNSQEINFTAAILPPRP